MQRNEDQELQKRVQETNWDEGVIREFMKLPTTNAYAYDLSGGHTLLLVAERPVDRVAVETEALLEWLGPQRPFCVVLWWRDDPRRISATEWPSRRTVNGGWTSSGSSTVCVYRSEEWDRVVLHEMIHALEWDWRMPEKPAACWGASEGQYSHALFEAWTELLAEWLWCGWHARSSDKKGVSWESQRTWQDFQATQILARNRTKKWSENTSVFAYYVLKAALAPHMPFLWLHQNGDSAEERERLLCRLVRPSLASLRSKSESVHPKAISLRMTKDFAK